MAHPFFVSQKPSGIPGGFLIFAGAER